MSIIQAMRNKTAILNEATYHYDDKDINKVEKLMGEAIDCYTKTDSAGVYAAFKKAGDILAEKFNFKEVVISMSEMPTSTYPARYSMRINKWINDIETVKTPSGPKFKEKVYDAAIFINSADLGRLTDKQLTAFLLHEIGHSFSNNRNSYILMVNPLMWVGMLVVAFIKFLVKTDNKIYGVLYKSKTYTALANFALAGSKFFGYITDVLNKFILHIPFVYLELAKQMSPISSLLQYDDEKFSDAFASSYGYGPALSEGLRMYSIKNRFGEDGKGTERNRFLNFTYSTNELIAYLLKPVMSPHPAELNRLANDIKYLEKAIEDTKDPNLKKYMLKDIQVLKDLYKEVGSDDLLATAWIMSMRYNDDEPRPIGDYREAFSKLKEDWGALN